MSFTILASTAWKALHRKPSRSLLTMLGVIIGVFAVISSMAIGAGAGQPFLDKLKASEAIASQLRREASPAAEFATEPVLGSP